MTIVFFGENKDANVDRFEGSMIQYEFEAVLIDESRCKEALEHIFNAVPGLSELQIGKDYLVEYEFL